MSSAREDILKRIDAAKLGMDTTTPSRNYVTDSNLTRDQLIDLLEDRIIDYKATFTRTTDVASTIAALVAQHDLQKIVIPSGLPAQWAQGTIDVDLSSGELDQFDAVITASEVSIAVTGTIILNHSRENQGRRAISLVPDTHICIVSAGSVVGTVVEAVRSLNAKDHQTWISGPSATSDIELERVEGVHGPRNLHVVLDLSDLKEAK
ncbi:MAG: LUD domain-containing protein [Actinobacteria bacterium]|nr:LUD domain-containing protein [Actinomycetota bacterium]